MPIVASRKPMPSGAPWNLIQRLFEALPGQWALQTRRRSDMWAGVRAHREDGLTLDDWAHFDGACRLFPNFLLEKRLIRITLPPACVQLNDRAASLRETKKLVDDAAKLLATEKSKATKGVKKRAALAAALEPFLGTPMGKANSNRAISFTPKARRPGIGVWASLPEGLEIRINADAEQAPRVAAGIALAVRTDLSAHQRAEIVRDLLSGD